MVKREGRLEKFRATQRRGRPCKVCACAARTEIEADLREWCKLRDAGEPDIGTWTNICRWLQGEYHVDFDYTTFARHAVRHMGLDPGTTKL